MSTKPHTRRQGDGGTYLVIADNTAEFAVALQYAVHMARLHRGHVAIAKIIEPLTFTGWRNIETAAKAENRAQAEAELLALSAKVKDESGITPTFIIREGESEHELVSIVNGNPAISGVVLATTKENGPHGPLVSFFTSKGISEISVPLIVVPGHMKPSELKKLL